MRIVITGWAFQSYLDLKHKRVFSSKEYKTIIRPDAELLKTYDTARATKFKSSSFWGPFDYGNGQYVTDAFKMKWDSIGSGKVELRLGVIILGSTAYLCEAFTKNAIPPKRAALRMENQVDAIKLGKYISHGELK